jgi:hypothetical protein
MIPRHAFGERYDLPIPLLLFIALACGEMIWLFTVEVSLVGW